MSRLIYVRQKTDGFWEFTIPKVGVSSEWKPLLGSSRAMNLVRVRHCFNADDDVRDETDYRTRPKHLSFQEAVKHWLFKCFGSAISRDKIERNQRFLEEALELVQACDGTREDAHKLVEYVFNRPVGEPKQEVGGVMVTLAALCITHEMDMLAAGEVELERIFDPVVLEKIREKQKTKPQGSPLPQAVFDYKKLLKAYIEHVGEMEGVDFLGDRYLPLPGLSMDESKELVRVSDVK